MNIKSLLLILIAHGSLYCTEHISSTVSNGQSQEKPHKSKGIFNPFIDNLLADESEKRHMAIKDMRLDELYPKIEEYFSYGYLEYAKTALERVVTIEKNQTKLKDARLRLAKVYYDIEEYAEAQSAYTEFAELYPGSDKTEFAKYKAVDCGCKQISDCDRDQKSTREAAKVAKEYLGSKTCQEYRNETKELCELCYDRLLDHELYVAEFHIGRGKYKPAQKRIDYAREKYLPELPEAREKIEKVQQALDEVTNARTKRLEKRKTKRAKKTKVADSSEIKPSSETEFEITSLDSKTTPAKPSKKKKVSFADRF